MHANARLGFRLLAGLAVVGLVLGYAGGVRCGKRATSAAWTVIFPPHQAVLLSGRFHVICLGKDENAGLEVDGKPCKWQPFQAPLRVARVSLAPGAHELRLGQLRRQFVVAGDGQKHDGPPQWNVYRFHPIEFGQEPCAACHQTRTEDGQTAVGPLRPYEACFACHRSVEFDAIHSHPLEPIQHCQMCHSLHGSARKGLLKAPVKQLCLDCHDA